MRRLELLCPVALLVGLGIACDATPIAPGSAGSSDGGSGQPVDQGPSAADATPGVADGGGRLDVGAASGSDGGATDGGGDVGVRADGGPGADAGAVRDGGAADGGVVQCGPLAAAGHAVCVEGPSACHVVFDDGAGCAAVCSSVGLTCAQSYEDESGQCAPDTSRPPLECGDTGHQSDYCVCVAAGCSPSCGAARCGDDGCGGSCGTCASGQRCVNQACEQVPPGPAEDCAQYPFQSATLLAERVGFGAAATGGDPSNVYRVTTLATRGPGSLRAALESASAYWIVFDVNGTITHRQRVDVRSNKTIDGRGRDITLEGNLRLEDARNVIVSDVALTNPLEGFCGQDGDVVTITGRGGRDPSSYASRDIWFHHVALYNGGDGLFDVRGGSNITLSWSHLYDHKKGMLLGLTADQQPAPGMRLTMHHNFFDRLSLRGPQLLYGWLHYFNNYQFEWWEYGAAGLAGSQLASEANVYQARPGRVCLNCQDPNRCGDRDSIVSKEALVFDWASNGPGATRSVGDLALEDAIIAENQPATVFDPAASYGYVAAPATVQLAEQIRMGAGPRTTYCN